MEWGGVGDARYATSVRNGNGVSSYSGATVDVSRSTVSDSTGNGFAAWGNGYVNAASSSISGSGGWALSAWGMSRVYGYAATSTGNVGSLKSHWASNVYFQSGTSPGNDYSFYQWGNGYIGAPSARFSDSASTYASGANDFTDLIYY